MNKYKIMKNNNYYYIIRKLFGFIPIYLSDEYVNNKTIKHKWKFIIGKFKPEKFKNENDASEFIVYMLYNINNN
jgi:hypothetical protein